MFFGMYLITSLGKHHGEKVRFEITRTDESIVDAHMLHVAASNCDQTNHNQISVVTFETLSLQAYLLGKVTVKRGKSDSSVKLVVTFDVKGKATWRTILEGSTFLITLLRGNMAPFSTLVAVAQFLVSSEAKNPIPARENNAPTVAGSAKSVGFDLYDHNVDPPSTEEAEFVILPRKRRTKQFVQNTRINISMSAMESAPQFYGYLFEESSVQLPQKTY